MTHAQIQTQIINFSQELSRLRNRLYSEANIDTSILDSKAEALYDLTRELLSNSPTKSVGELKKSILVLISDLDFIEKEFIQKHNLLNPNNEIKPNALISAYRT